MDYSTNQRFFNPDNARMIKRLVIFSIPLFVIAAVLLWYWGFGLLILRILGYVLAVGGIALLAIAFGKRVKEGEVTAYVEQGKKEVSTLCGDALGYPSDLASGSLFLTGAVTADQLPAGAFPGKKLKSGSILTPEVAYSFLYIRKNGVYTFSRIQSLVEEKTVDKNCEFTFEDFDSAVIEPVTAGEKASLLKLKKGKEVVWQAPTFLNDYSQDEFVANLLHTRERYLR